MKTLKNKQISSEPTNIQLKHSQTESLGLEAIKRKPTPFIVTKGIFISSLVIKTELFTSMQFVIGLGNMKQSDKNNKEISIV